MQLNGSQIFVEVLVEQGVDTIFGYPGGTVLNLYDELYRNTDRITHVLTAHEQGAAHAADGYARATGKTGVVLATSGPGAANLVTGIATAYMDSVPMVAFTGNVATDSLGRDSFQEVYIEGITMPITKHSVTVRRVEDLAPAMRRAFRIARSGRRGPVLVDIPKDVTAAYCEFESQVSEDERTIVDVDMSEVAQAAAMLASSSRPLLLIGGGVRSAHGCEYVRAIAHDADVPVVHTLMGTGILRYDDPLNLGLLGMHGSYSANKAVAEADLVISVGSRFSDRVALVPDTFADKAQIVQIDLDGSEMGKIIDADLEIVGDAAYVLRALQPLAPKTTHEEWRAQIARWQQEDFSYKRAEDRIVPQQLVEEICEMTGPDAYYVTDVGQHQIWAAQYLKHVASRHFITSGGLGTMGFGYGAAIGAQMGLGPEARVVMLTGDGSFHMNMNEACTAVSYGLPIITVIFNNAVLGMVRQWQDVFYGARYSQTDPHRKTDYVKVAEGFGAKGFRCETMPEFREAYKEALGIAGPVWIDCRIDPNAKVLPMIPAGKDISQIIMEWGE